MNDPALQRQLRKKIANGSLSTVQAISKWLKARNRGIILAPKSVFPWLGRSGLKLKSRVAAGPKSKAVVTRQRPALPKLAPDPHFLASIVRRIKSVEQELSDETKSLKTGAWQHRVD